MNPSVAVHRNLEASMNSITAILFDADGVIQRPAVDYRSAFAALAAFDDEKLDRFVSEVFAAERPSLTGQGDFLVDLHDVLERWSLRDRVEEVLKIWTSIETDSAMFALIATLRSLGIQCCLATNQQAHRGTYMSETLRYRDTFDFQFYSHRIGFAKPASGYFRAVVSELNLDPAALLFIDDHEPNVTAARTVGINAALFSPGSASADALRAILLEHNLRLD
jgi:putative hydrolase of the HAD superfamily